jgi:hypothetical protein
MLKNRCPKDTWAKILVIKVHGLTINSPKSDGKVKILKVKFEVPIIRSIIPRR